jgi:hypothetical protein
MEEKEINPAESLDIINRMINTSKNKLADDGFMFIFWGWLVCIAALTHYVTIRMNLEQGHLVWPILMPLGGVVSAIYGYRQKKKTQVRTYIDVYLGYLWGAFAIALFFSLAFMYKHGVHNTYFFLMLLYGIATFVSGGLLNFKPLIIGSIVSFFCAAASVYLGEAEQLLIISISLFASYIIPGHLLRAEYKSQNNV